MNYAACLLMFVLGGALTILRGSGFAFGAVYLPALLFLANADVAPVPLLPQLRPHWAALLGIVAAQFVRPWTGGARWGLLDALICVIGIYSGVSVVVTSGSLHAGISVGLRNVMSWTLPYLIARIAFQSPEGRKAIFWSLVVCITTIGLLAIFESRAWPTFWEWVLSMTGVRTYRPHLVLVRYGAYRANVSLPHPIYLANASVIVGAIVLLLDRMIGVATIRTPTRIALAGVVLAVIGSMSFSGLNGLAASLVLFALSIRSAGARRFVTFGSCILIAVGVGATFLLRNVSPERTSDMSPMEESLRVRAYIVQNTWPMVTRAGLFGHGEFASAAEYEGMGTVKGSTDNSYLVFILYYGWGFLALWLLIMVTLAMRVSAVLSACPPGRIRNGLAIGIATVLGMSVAMYTVWADSSYTTLWLILIGGLVSLAQQVAPLASLAERRRYRPAARLAGPATSIT